VTRNRFWSWIPLLVWTACAGRGPGPAGTDPRMDGRWKGCVLGMFTADGEARFPGNGEAGIRAFETLIGKPVGSVMWYCTWDDTFPSAACETARRLGCIPHVTWELFRPSVNANNGRPVRSPSETGLDDVLAGKCDAVIDSFAAGARRWGGPVMIRFLHEFNGNWYVWGGLKNGGADGGPRKVVAVWRYTVERFRRAGARNVSWIWCPHGPSIDRSPEPWNAIKNYWPGGDTVDWIGLDAYNWYPRDPWGSRRPYDDFRSCFGELYRDCAKLGDQPMLIAEFASGEFNRGGAGKAEWIRDAFSRLKEEYPRIKIVTWFHIDKELDWRVNSSDAALKAFREAVSDPYFIGPPGK
jgi:hypothetical protein